MKGELKYDLTASGRLLIGGEYANCAFVDGYTCGARCAAFEVFEETRYANRYGTEGDLVTLHCVKREIFIPRGEAEK